MAPGSVEVTPASAARAPVAATVRQQFVEREALRAILAIRLDETLDRDEADVFNEARMKMRAIAEAALRGVAP